jgi:hypothetical protein
MGGLLKSFLFFFLIFFSLEVVYRLSLKQWPSNTVEALIIAPVALIFAFALARIFNSFRERRIRKE